MTELSLVQLRHFCAAAESGSIAEAARLRHVSATAVGAAITALERTLDTRLCVRERSRGIHLTPAGHQFYAEARRVIRSADDLVHRQPGATIDTAGPLVVGGFQPIAPAVLPSLLERFEHDHPTIQVEFTTGPMLPLVEGLLAGDLHCAFGYDVFSRSGQLPTGLAVELLYETELCVLVARDHPLARRPHVSIEDLVDEPMILFESNPSQRYSAPALGRLHPGARVRHKTSDFELMRAMVARGLGHSLIMNPIPAGASFEGLPLAKVPLHPSLASSSVVAIRPEGRWQHPAMRLMVDLAHDLVARGQLGASL